MKTNKKALELVETGLNSKVVSKLSESQIEELHSKIFSEQTGVRKEIKPTEVTTIAQSALDKGVNVDGKTMKKDTSGNVVVTSTNEEMSEEDDKDSKNNPWAICHKQLGPRKNAKFESCVKQVKKSLKEGKNPVSLFIESKIMEIVETHLPPKITKKDLVKYLSEAEPATAPAPTKDPKTKPGTKEPPSPVKTPSHPGKNPNPKVNPSPKAKNVDPEEAKEKIIDTIMKMLKK
jgi:hypothetical protein